MALIHALLTGCSDSPSLDKYGCVGGSYRVDGVNLIEKIVSDPNSGSPFVFPVANAKQNKLYVKRGSGEIWRYDLDTFSNPSFVGAFGNRGNFLVDENTSALYLINYFGDLARVDTQGPSVASTIVAPAIFDPNSYALFSSEPVLQWRRPPTSSQTTEICIQVSYGGNILAAALGEAPPIFPDDQAILRFDPNSSVLLPELVSKAAASGSNGIKPSNCFAFGPDGLLYVVKAFVSATLPPQVWRFDGTTGAFKDVFISGTQITSNPTQLLFAPDGKSLLLTAGDVILQFALDGSLITTIPLAHTIPGYSTFVSQTLDLQAPRVPSSHYAFLIAILAGLVGDNSGWIHQPGRPWPEPWPGWELAAERIWHSLGPDERNAVIALGIRELGSMMTEPKAREEIRHALNRSLGENTLKRLATLLRMYRYEP